jgi:hypothetical protein
MMTVSEAARISGWSEDYIRRACRRGVLGDAYNDLGSGKRTSIVVFPGRLAEALGISVEELEKRRKEL